MDDLGPATSVPRTFVPSSPSQVLLVMTWPGQEGVVCCDSVCQYGAAGQPLTSCKFPDPEACAALSSTDATVTLVSAVNVAVTGAAVVWTPSAAPPGFAVAGAAV